MKEFIYGVNIIESALKSGHKIYRVFVKEGKHIKLINKIKDLRIPISPLEHVDWKEFKIPMDAKTQGIVAIVHKKVLLSVKELILKVQKIDNPVLVMADKITDPHNIGSILRNISAFGAQGLIISKNNSSPINSTVHKTSVGNSFFVDIAQISSMAQAIRILKEKGFWIVDTRMSGEMTIESIAGYNEPLVIVLGSEGSGVSENILKKSDMSLSIRMSGTAESLNVAATSAIILHALQK